MSDRAVLKWPVAVDDRPHRIGGGPVVHVDCQNPHDPSVITIWTIEPRYAQPEPKRRVQVFGTGQPLPFFAEHLGTAIALDGQLVWHAFQLPDPRNNDESE